MKKKRLWILFLSLSLLAGILLRMTYVHDMEYKEDEEYNFTQSQKIGTTEPWPCCGIPSGVYLVNPGMSIWVFAALAKLTHAQSPTALAHSVQLFALLGICLIIPFGIILIPSQEERKTWGWAFALALVNPFLILYQRKLWPEPFLPFFTMITLTGWWTRSSRWGALIWGLIGAFLGQIHMSGFFFSASLFLWTLLFDPKRNSVQWRAWFLGSVLGALPLVPWGLYAWNHPLKESMSGGWNEIVQLKYWVFWITNPTGLHLGNPLGLLRGPSNWNQISDFVRYPLIQGHPTYGVGLAHLGAAVCSALIFFQGFMGLKKQLVKSLSHPSTLVSEIIGQSSPTAFVQNAAFIGCGILLTLTGVNIRRYYMAVTFPLEFIFLVRMANPSSRMGIRLLTALWICECFISAHFVGYIHVHEGSVWGDYGQAYHLVHPNAE